MKKSTPAVVRTSPIICSVIPIETNAKSNKISSPIRQLVLLCFHYNPIRGKYGVVIMNTLRVGGIATLAGLALVIVAARRVMDIRKAGERLGVDMVCPRDQSRYRERDGLLEPIS